MLSILLFSYDSVLDRRKWSNLNIDYTRIFSLTNDMFRKPNL